MRSLHAQDQHPVLQGLWKHAFMYEWIVTQWSLDRMDQSMVEEKVNMDHQ